MTSLRDLTPKDIEKVFWSAMKNGWSSGYFKKQEDPLLPGYKCIPFKTGRFSVLDMYCVTPLNDKSAGTTTIWFDDVPVWMMHYGGEYPQRVIPFLKLALQFSIARQKFVGGRGPVYFTHVDYPDLVYVNSVHTIKNTFLNFRGGESVYEGDNSVGHHYYRGMILI